MTIEAAITNLQSKLLGLSGMKSAPDKVPEGTGPFPFGVSYERKGELSSHSAAFGDELVTLFSEIHVSRAMLSAAIVQAMSFRDPFLKAVINDPTLGGSIATIRDVRWSFGVLQWGGVETLGYRFEIDVKVQVSV